MVEEVILMNLIIWLALGAISGYLAALIMGMSRDNWLLHILLGIVGGVVGGAVAVSLGLGAVTGFNLYSLLISVLGACLVLLLYRLLQRFF